MAAHLEAPCRASAETRRHLEKQAQRDQFAERFDEWRDDHLAAILPAEMVAPVQALLTARPQITEPSQRAQLDRLYDACVVLWEAL